MRRRRGRWSASWPRSWASSSSRATSSARVALPQGGRLRVLVARLLPGSPPPAARPGEHDALRWLAADELDDVDWLPANAALLPPLRGHLRRR